VRTIHETVRPVGGLPFYSQPEWADRFPWVVQGTTGKQGEPPPDLGLAGERPVRAALGNWWRLLGALPVSGLVLARQVHAAHVVRHVHGHAGVLLTTPADGHVTSARGLGLAVTVADCVPVFLVSQEPRAVALLHAGWRGTAAGILDAGIAALRRQGAAASAIHLHLGPAICGACYEVGPEVHEALGLSPTATATPVDLRPVLAERGLRAGITAEQITASAWCTLHDDAFFSHRRGEPGRQIGVLGLTT
jgi:YfiH family protein